MSSTKPQIEVTLTTLATVVADREFWAGCYSFSFQFRFAV